MRTITLILHGKITAIYTFDIDKDADKKFIELCTDAGWNGVHNEAEKLIKEGYHESNSGSIQILYKKSIHNN